MYWAQKNVTLFQYCRSGTGVSCWKSVWNLTFCSFLDKKQLQKRLCARRKKKRYIFSKLLLWYRGFCWNYVWNLTFCSFFDRKNLKKQYVTCKQTVMFCENCCIFAGGFFWSSVWNLTFCLFFKKPLKNMMYLSKKPLRFVEIVVFLRAIFS